jgi:hypothetical protein
MKLTCHLRGHSVAPHAVQNLGFQFSRCRRCRCDMIRSTASDSSKWTIVPPEFRIAWNGVEPNKMFDPHYYLSAITRIRGIFSSARDALFVSLRLTLSSIADVFRIPYKALFAVKAPRQLIVFASAPITAKQWRVSAGLGAEQKLIRFECIFEKRAA